MKKISSQIFSAFTSDNKDAEVELKKALRAGQVRAIWADLVEDAILQHTNGVYIIKEDEKTVMHVYVDESIYAAELNNRRELIQLLCNMRYREQVDEFQIHISYGSMKKVYPYRNEAEIQVDKRPAVKLTEEELLSIEKSCACIEKDSLREQLKKAMIADLEWKKGNPQ